MNKNVLRVTLILLLQASLWPQCLIRAQNPAASPSPASAANRQKSEAGQKVKLYYMREATKIKAVLNAIAKQNGSVLEGLIVENATEDEMILYGPEEKRNQARRVIATLDLPRPGIVMEMWGVQITSRNPENLAKVMARVRREINRTQQDVREFYSKFEEQTRYATRNVNRNFSHLLVNDLFYRTALSLDHPLSLADVLLRLTAAENPGAAAAQIANGLQDWVKERRRREQARLAQDIRKTKKQKTTIAEAPTFERFFVGRGLTWNNGRWEANNDVNQRAEHARRALVEFAFQYGYLIHRPQSFSPYSLQQASEILNTRLQSATEALNFDMQEMFVEPTLDRIAEIVREFKDVEYAQVGKTSVASLSGIQADVTSRSVNTFDVTPPLRLSELLKKADELSKSVGPFVPKPADNVVGAMPLSQVIGLIGAFGEERSVWRELQSGISLTITPNVLRNMTSAELKVVLKTGDPQLGNTPPGAKPLSRVSQHDVSTSIYVEPLDFFDLSAFASQSTLGGGRGYVPIIGPVWRGIFGEVPVAGKLFSWKRDPQTVFSESLVLTTSFITPTSMGVAVLYPTELIDDRGERVEYTEAILNCQKASVFNYKNNLSVSRSGSCLRPDSNQNISTR